MHFFLIDKNVHMHVHMIFVQLPFFFFLGPRRDSWFFVFKLDVIFFFFWDMIFIYFLIIYGDCSFFFFLWLFVTCFFFNWVSFFNKGIWVNLFKLNFSISPLFHFQPNKNERKIKIFSILLHFHSPTIFYPPTFSPF